MITWNICTFQNSCHAAGAFFLKLLKAMMRTQRLKLMLFELFDNVQVTQRTTQHLRFLFFAFIFFTVRWTRIHMIYCKCMTNNWLVDLHHSMRSSVTAPPAVWTRQLQRRAWRTSFWARWIPVSFRRVGYDHI